MVPSTLNFFLEKSNFSPHHFENKKVYVVSYLYIISVNCFSVRKKRWFVQRGYQQRTAAQFPAILLFWWIWVFALSICRYGHGWSTWRVLDDKNDNNRSEYLARARRCISECGWTFWRYVHVQVVTRAAYSFWTRAGN